MYSLFEKFLIYFIILVVMVAIISIGIIWGLDISNNSELRKIQTSASLLMVIGLLIAITQYNFNRKQAKNTFDFDKKKTTINDLPKINDTTKEITLVLNEKINFFKYMNTRTPYTLKDFNKFCNEYKNFEICSNIRELLNIYEFLSMTIHNNIYDEELIKSMMGQRMILTYLIFSEYIHILRKEHGIPNIYIEYEKIVKKWQPETKSNNTLDDE